MRRSRILLESANEPDTIEESQVAKIPDQTFKICRVNLASRIIFGQFNSMINRCAFVVVILHIELLKNRFFITFHENKNFIIVLSHLNAGIVRY